MSLQLVPDASHPSSTSTLSTRGASVPSAPSAPGLPDQLRANIAPSSTQLASIVSPHTDSPESSSTHPLEARLRRWRATQHALKMEGLRRTFGLAEPVRRGMELHIVREGEWRAQELGGSEGVHGDILEGRDTLIEWEDVFTHVRREGEGVKVQEEIEARVRMHD